ncbi:MAG: AAA family ATPase [Proteobacteria bacterium]|nr:AAA family ATPase [Pseudomonadota bacterium]
MKLFSLGLLNWANLKNDNYSFGDVNMITGESGSGKTTLLDAIQTILTGTTSGLYQYNPGQEEATQKSRTKETRTLASYILGCDDGSYSRPEGCYGYVISNWVPEPGEQAEPFSAVIGVSAYIDMAGSKKAAKEEELLLSIIRMAELGIEDFQTSEKDGRKNIVPVSQIIPHFKANRPNLIFDVARGKEEYLCWLYGAFRGKQSINRHEARNAAKAVSKFMVYKPIKSLDDFVRTDILEPYDLGDAIRQVSSMMRNISGMEKESINISNGIGLLKQAGKGVSDFIETTIDEQLAEYEHTGRDVARLQELIFQSEEDLQMSLKKKEDLEQKEMDIKSQSGVLYDTLRTLEIKSQGIDVLVRKRELEAQIGRLENELRHDIISFLNVNHKRRTNRITAVKLSQILNRDSGWLGEEKGAAWEMLLTRIIKNDTWDQISFEPLFSERKGDDLKTLNDTAQVIDQAHNALSDKLLQDGDSFSERFFHTQAAVKNMQDKIKKLSREIVQLENANEISYPQNTRKALTLIQSAFPDADARVLCDHIEVIDETWQMAIESLIGGNRFLILVHPDYETRVLALIEKNGLHKSAVIQGKKAGRDIQNRTLPPGSIVHLLKFNHQLAENYLKASYGSVLQVDDVETLRMTPRGLMKNSMASAGYKMFVETISESDLVFGTAARMRALKAKRDVLLDLEKQHESIQDEYIFFKVFHESVKDVSPIKLSEPFSKIIRLISAKEDQYHQLNDLDLSEYQEIETKILQTREDIDHLSDALRQINQEVGSLTNEIKARNIQIKDVLSECDQKRLTIEKKQDILNTFERNWPKLDLDKALESIHGNKGFVEPLRKWEGVNFGGQLNMHEKTVQNALETFNQIKIRGRSIDYSLFSQFNLSREQSPEDNIRCFNFSCDLFRQIDQALNFLTNDILSSHKEKLQDMTRRFNTTFVSHICHTMHNAIREGKTRLEALNRKLRNHVFGEEYYRFEYEWIPEYREYVRFFKASMLINPDADVSLFGEGHLSEEHKRIFNIIISKLLDDDIERSLRDLKRITDYRNYRSYDIKKCLPDRELSLKNYGTGSGGQMETPSYVIRSAGLSSALYFDEGESHLRMVMIDESFSKMDEHRIRSVLNYLSGKMGLQILFVVPSKSAGVLHDCVDRVFQVTKLKTGSPRGELNTYVMVNTNIMRKDKVEELWRSKRTAVKNRAHQLDFLDLLEKKNKPAENVPI